MKNNDLCTLAETWGAPYVARREVYRFSGGIVTPRHLANEDSRGSGPVGKITVNGRVAIGPQAETDWLVVPNLWALLVGRPGLLKSPAMEAMLAPLKTLAQEAAGAFQGALAENEAALLAHKLRREAAEKAVRQKLARDPTADIGAELLIVLPEAPSQKRFLAGNSGAEALGELLRQNPEGILVHRGEMMSLLRWLDREDNAAARGLYLSA
jgi:putative DNA primase/helicase